jgi:hypothetical protein
MLLFLSSGARNRYRDDIVRSLALPEGGFLQFRYDISIVDAKILESTKSGQLLNRDALVCYIWTGAIGAPTDFVPCRLARVTGAEIVGSSFVVRFEVAGYVQLGKGIDFLALLSEEDRQKTPKWERDADTFRRKGLFAITLKSQPNLNTSKELDAFESIVKKLRSFSDFSGDKARQFFAVMGVDSVIRDSQGREIYDKMHLLLHGSFILKSGLEYEMRVYVFAPDVGPTASIRETLINIDSENKLLEFPQGKSCEIDSEYDVKRFRFITQKNIYTFSGALTLFVGTAEERSCDIIIPAVFERDFKVGIIRMVLITIGSSVPAMLAAQATEKLSPGLGLIMLIAAAATGIGTVFFGSRKT